MTSAYSLASLPTSTAASIPLSMTNNTNPNKQSKQHNHDETKFIWKERPNSQIETSKEEIVSEKSAESKDVVMRTRGVGGPVHKRKDMHHTRRHTLQGGVDFSMVCIVDLEMFQPQSFLNGQVLLKILKIIELTIATFLLIEIVSRLTIPLKQS